MSEITYMGKTVPVYGAYDTVIIGGGTAGAAAGIWSAKCGNKTLIIEKMTSLGGTAVHALVSPMMPSSVDHLELYHEIEERLKQYGAVTRDGYSKSMWFSGEDMAFCLESFYLENGGELLYDACFIDAIVENRQIQYVLVRTVEGMMAVKGACFVDASGDCVLSRASGVEYCCGDAAGFNQISSLRFEMGGIDIERYRSYCQSIHDEFCPMKEGEFFESAMVAGQNFALEPVFRKGVEDGVLKEEDLRYYQCFTIPGKPGSMSFNCPHISGLTKNTDARKRSEGICEGHQMIRRLVRFLKGSIPGFETAYLQKEASMLGIRESYRIAGKYMLTEHDYISRARFSDGIVKGDWYIDIHSAENGLVQKDEYQPGEYYEIPYRCLIQDQAENLITIGRCISATFRMQASVRIQATLTDMGQMAGEACAYARKNGIPLNAVDGSVLRRI